MAALVELPNTDKKGWKVIERGDTSVAGELWNQLSDGAGTAEFGRSEKLLEKALGQVLGLNYSVYFKPERRGNKVYVRFTDTRETRGKSGYKTTEEIWKDVLDLSAE